LLQDWLPEALHLPVMLRHILQRYNLASHNRRLAEDISRLGQGDMASSNSTPVRLRRLRVNHQAAIQDKRLPMVQAHSNHTINSLTDGINLTSNISKDRKVDTAAHTFVTIITQFSFCFT
jgi:hypothetical protein